MGDRVMARPSPSTDRPVFDRGQCGPEPAGLAHRPARGGGRLCYGDKPWILGRRPVAAAIRGTALYHFLFVPLTLGLSMMLVIMESSMS